MVCYQTSLFNPPFSDVLASMNSSMVGVFAPHELTNTTNQGSTYCFVGCLEQMTANYSPWAKSSPLTVLYSSLWTHRLALWAAETKLGIPHCVPSLLAPASLADGHTSSLPRIQAGFHVHVRNSTTGSCWTLSYRVLVQKLVTWQVPLPLVSSPT